MKSFLMFLLGLLCSFEVMAAEPSIAKWSENSFGLALADVNGEEKSSVQYLIVNEMRFEKHSFVSQFTSGTADSMESNYTNYSFGYSIGPDWQLPFEPRLDVRAGVTYLRNADDEATFSPSMAVKLRVVTLKMPPFALGLFMEGGHLYKGASYFSTGLCITLGAQ